MIDSASALARHWKLGASAADAPDANTREVPNDTTSANAKAKNDGTDLT
ncbi:unannotated protein [freshwater metagenome]|uniref:Unannotated protein n=1 Tax=freshwater metagenome TaxID=449393 RepID=A0A6J7I3H7_9ZZZZ